MNSTFKNKETEAEVAMQLWRQINCFNKAKYLHCQMLKAGDLQDAFVANNLMSLFIDLSHVQEARALFDEMIHPTVFSLTRILSAYTSSGDPHESISLFNLFIDTRNDIAPNRITFSVILKACGLVGDIKLGKKIHSNISSHDLNSDIVLANSLLDMYAKCGSLLEARKVFDSIIPRASSTSWNTMISAYSRAGFLDEAVNLFHRIPHKTAVSYNTMIAAFAEQGSLRGLNYVSEMQSQSFVFDEFTFPCALKICSHFSLSSQGEELHCSVVKAGYTNNLHTASSLIDMYSNFHRVNEAEKIFNQFVNQSSPLSLMNSLLSGYVLNHKTIKALLLLKRIYLLNEFFNCYSLSSALKSCINLENLQLGRQLHSLTISSSFSSDFIIASLLIELYLHKGQIDIAMKIFRLLEERDVLIWSNTVTNCAKLGFSSHAFGLFKEMMSNNIKADDFVASAILKASAEAAELHLGREVHAFCVKRGFEFEDVTASALVNMYSKCGEIKEALSIFNCIERKDVVCWTGMIMGCAQNGFVGDALKVFDEMIESKMAPNTVTFLGALMACRHGGLVESARRVFGLMGRFGVEPGLEHYFCLVDLLSKRGSIEEANEVISKMPHEADRSIWNVVIGGGQGRVDDVASGEVLSGFGDDPSVYVMMSNAYAASGKWEALDELRKEGKKFGAKLPGISWV